MTTGSALAVRYVDYLTTGDESILDEAFTPDFLDHVSGRRGTEIMRVVRGWLERSFADLRYEVHAVTAGDGVIMIWFSSSGRHVGSEFPQFAGREPTGRRIVAEAVHIFRVHDGKLAEHWAVRDDLGVLRQLDGGEAGGDRPRRPD
jgi:lactoylglutathione lyase